MNPKQILCSAAAVLLLPLGFATASARAEAPAAAGDSAPAGQLQPGANVLPYEIHNVATGEEYCQMCAYAERAGTVAVYGNFHDDKFWADLEKLQAVQNSHRNFGCFGQVLDSQDAAAINAEAKKHHLTIPVVYAVDPEWTGVYKVGGVSRTVYYSSNFKILWTGLGLDQPSLTKLDGEIKQNPRS